MTREESQNEATLPYDHNKSDSSSVTELKGGNEVMQQPRENKSTSPHERGLSKSPTGSSSGFPSRSGSNIESEVSETEQYIRSITNKTNDLGSEDSFLSYRSDEEPPRVRKRRSGSFDDGPRVKHHPQTKKHASDLIGLASKNFPYHLTERQKAMVYPRYKTERHPDPPRKATSKEKLAAVEYHTFDLPDVTPEQIRAAYLRSSEGGSYSSINQAVPSSSYQPPEDVVRPIVQTEVDAFVERHPELFNFNYEERYGIYPSSDGEVDYDGLTLSNEEEEGEEIKSGRDDKSVSDESEDTKVEERCPTAELSEHASPAETHH